jgi:hypothetical protein
LQSLSRDVKGEIFRVDNTLDEVEVLGNDVFAIVHDENAAHVEFDVIALLLRLEEVEGSALRDEEDSLEFELTFNRKVLDSKVIFPVVGKTFVERAVLLACDVRWVACPDRLRLVELFVRDLLLLDLLGFLLLLVFILFDFLDLGLLALFLLLSFLLLFILNLLQNRRQRHANQRWENAITFSTSFVTVS